MKTTWIAIGGVALGIFSGLAGKDRYDAWQKSHDCCSTKHEGAAAACPARYQDGKMVVTDQKEVDRLRRSMRDGVFRPWLEMGRAPTPDEVGERLGLNRAATADLLDQLESCGESVQFGVRRVPESDLIAVAWPLANVPTGITVTLDGGKAAQARCAVDALGVSKMMGKRATVEAEMGESKKKLRVVVDGDRLVEADPPDAVVFKGAGCDQMLFFASDAEVQAWKTKRSVSGGRVFKMDEAVKHGAEIFGKLTDGLTG